MYTNQYTFIHYAFYITHDKLTVHDTHYTYMYMHCVLLVTKEVWLP